MLEGVEMEVQDLVRRALQVRRLYVDFEKWTYGREWTKGELVLGFVGDVGDLAKLTMAVDGMRSIQDAEQKLAHELADCLWSLLVLSELYGVDLEQAFTQTMDELERHIARSAPQECASDSDQPST